MGEKRNVHAINIPRGNFPLENGLIKRYMNLQEHGVKLSYMPFFIKAASMALRQFPMINAHTATDPVSGDLQMIYKAAHNVSMAIDTENGLTVPNIKRCEARSIIDIAVELTRLQTAAADNRLTQSDLQDGTFTFSNIGSV